MGWGAHVGGVSADWRLREAASVKGRARAQQILPGWFELGCCCWDLFASSEPTRARRFFHSPKHRRNFRRRQTLSVQRPCWSAPHTAPRCGRSSEAGAPSAGRGACFLAFFSNSCGLVTSYVPVQARATWRQALSWVSACLNSRKFVWLRAATRFARCENNLSASRRSGVLSLRPRLGNHQFGALMRGAWARDDLQCKGIDRSGVARHPSPCAFRRGQDPLAAGSDWGGTCIRRLRLNA